MPILDDDLHGRRLRGKCHGNDRDVGDHSVIPGDHVGNFDAGLDDGEAKLQKVSEEPISLRLSQREGWQHMDLICRNPQGEGQLLGSSN